MKCPSCSGIELKPTALEDRLIAAECGVCEGVMLPLMNYRYWLETAEGEPSSTDCSVEILDSEKAKLCPKCNMFMLKYKLGAESDNRLDYCGCCDEMWLDKNEWYLLKQLGLSHHLHEIVTEQWQKDVRKKQQQQSIDNSYKEKLGEENFAVLKEFSQWLSEQGDKAYIRQYLNLVE